MRRFGIVTAAALLTTAWAGPGPAAADDLHHLDASGDVIAVDKNDWTDGGPGIAPAASEAKDPDFLAVDLRHTATNVVMVLHIRGMLGPTDSTENTVDRRWVGRIQTAQHRFRVEGYYLDVGTWMGLFRDGKQVRCDGQSVALRYADRIIKFRWPRACLENPNWVRAGVKLARINYVKGPNGIALQDDPFVAGNPANASAAPTLSRRLVSGPSSVRSSAGPASSAARTMTRKPRAAVAERIVFVRWYRNGGASAIFTAAPDGTDRQQLTRPGDNFEPRWSPGGGRIAYTHGTALWLMRADGTNKHKVLAHAFMPSWAPDGGRLLINRLGQDGVKFGILNLRTKAVRWYAGNFDSARASDWSPRNNRIVFAGASEDVDDFLDDLYTVAPDFTGRAQATNSPRRAEVIARWAPAGAERLAYSLDDWAKTNGSRCFDRVAIGDINAGTRTRVSCSAYDPAWSPDASQLLISHQNEHNDSALESVDLSTGIRTVIVPPTKRFFAASEPDWRSCS